MNRKRWPTRGECARTGRDGMAQMINRTIWRWMGTRENPSPRITPNGLEYLGAAMGKSRGGVPRSRSTRGAIGTGARLGSCGLGAGARHWQDEGISGQAHAWGPACAFSKDLATQQQTARGEGLQHPRVRPDVPALASLGSEINPSARKASHAWRIAPVTRELTQEPVNNLPNLNYSPVGSRNKYESPRDQEPWCSRPNSTGANPDSLLILSRTLPDCRRKATPSGVRFMV